MSPMVPCGPLPRRAAGGEAIRPVSGMRVGAATGGRATRATRPARAAARTLLALVAAIAFGAGLGGQPASALSPLHGQPPPSWATAPQQTLIVRSRLPQLAAYPYVRGRGPSTRGGRLITLHNPTPQQLPLIMAGFAQRDGFVLALLPVFPNNTFGWVKASEVTISSTQFRIEISESRHRLLVWKGPTVIGSFPVAVGKPSTPTPMGDFFVNAVLPAPNAAYGTVVISTSGYSNVLKTFGDGDAAVGIHGTDEDGSVGHSVSHGCVRMHTRDAQLIAPLMKAGTLVVIGS